MNTKVRKLEVKSIEDAKHCLRCGNSYNGFPALSRRDNKTDICSDCGQEEAMIDFAFDSLDEPIKRELSFLRNLVRPPLDITPA